MKRHSADRTRSKRARAGSRRNKKHRNAHIQVCGEPHICLVHIDKPPIFPLPPAQAMRMRLTRCEQAWVDDLRSGRRHTHVRMYSLHNGRAYAIGRLKRRIRAAQEPTTHINVATASDPIMHGFLATRGYGKQTEQEARMAQARAAGLDVMQTGRNR